MIRFPVVSKSPSFTAQVGAKLAGQIKQYPTLILLDGPLGAGKTQFAQGFIHSHIGKKIPVLSPTYSVVNAYKLKNKIIYHVDLYRLRGVDDLESVGFWDFFEGPNLILVEWAEKLPHIWPKNVSTIHLGFVISSEKERVIQLSGAES